MVFGLFSASGIGALLWNVVNSENGQQIADLLANSSHGTAVLDKLSNVCTGLNIYRQQLKERQDLMSRQRRQRAADRVQLQEGRGKRARKRRILSRRRRPTDIFHGRSSMRKKTTGLASLTHSLRDAILANEKRRLTNASLSRRMRRLNIL